MEVGLEKTLVFLIFIALGLALKTKFKAPEEINGIKKIILNLALPAIICIALLGIRIDMTLLLLPLFALAFNVVLFGISPFVLRIIGVRKDTPAFRTARLLMPSLAPGLSCFPFVLEFLSDGALAKVAMADLGNKVFVLIVLYLIAMRWYYQKNQIQNTAGKAKLASLLKTLVTEPVNLFIALALILLGFGLTMDTIPFIFADSLSKLSLMMTPLVLLFIGLAVKFKKHQFAQIASVLLLRAGLVFLLVGMVKPLFGPQLQEEVLLMLAFGLSACSFWPYAHIAIVDKLEKGKRVKTFDSGYAVALLALSFPFSTSIILGVLNSGSLFVPTANLILTAIVFMGMGMVYPFVGYLRKKSTLIRLADPKIETAQPEHP
ncbi:MAG: permease [Flavobacteriaceae bacterium]|nr:permease [Flavobacteriaceae bacterium]